RSGPGARPARAQRNRRVRAHHRAAGGQRRVPPGNQPLAGSALMLLALLIGALFEGHAPFEKVGFYPLWENTGTLLDRREAILGTSYFEMGLGDVQVGIRPQEFLFRSPNLHA